MLYKNLRSIIGQDASKDYGVSGEEEADNEEEGHRVSNVSDSQDDGDDPDWLFHKDDDNVW